MSELDGLKGEKMSIFEGKKWTVQVFWIVLGLAARLLEKLPRRRICIARDGKVP